MDTGLLQYFFVASILLAGLVASLVPIKIYQILNNRMRQSLLGNNRKESSLSQWISCLSCFAGGVFLSVIFLHLLPDAHESLTVIQKKGVFVTRYPVVEIISLLGFFLVYMTEVLSETCVTQRTVTHDQTIVTKNPAILRRRRANTTTIDDKCEIHEDGHDFTPPPMESPYYSASSIPSTTAMSQRERTLIVRTITFITALVFHSMVEGFAFGVQHNSSTIISLFVGIIVHRTIVAFSVGTRMINCHPKRPVFVISLAIVFAVSSPLFSVLGMIVKESAIDELFKEEISLVLISLSIGTFLYIAFFEMLAPEKSNGNYAVSKYISTLAGFFVIAIVIYFE
uniref:Zinc transporter ZIP3 n=1 Tax=Bursaphelenchus xylophilus TaxID=6326 RepID=A0A1I7RZX5_BURXY